MQAMAAYRSWWLLLLEKTPLTRLDIAGSGRGDENPS